MQDSPEYDVIGVDGGGTSCRVAVIRGGRRYAATLGRANVTSDFDDAIRTIREGLVAVATKAGTRAQTLYALPAYLGLAGVLGPETATRVARALPFRRIRVEDDRVSTLTGALDGRNGAVAGIGTGSFLARRSGAQTRLMGGYGFRVGDDASAAWLGRALLCRTLHAIDGLRPASPLTNAVQSEYGGTAAGIVRFATAATPDEFGALAPRVVSAARAGDPDGCALMKAGATYIADGLAALGWQAGEPLCLTGGVGPQYRPFLSPEIAASVHKAAGTGLDGALKLAAALAAETAGGAA